MTPSVTIEEMREDDFGDVIRIDHLAFRSYNLPPRTRKNIAYAYSVNPAGCFTAKHDDSTVGFIFSRTWGSIGWLGTFGVDEAYRGAGIGKRLLRAARAGLQENERCPVIGLETPAESGYNIGFYRRAGFRIITPTLIVEKEITDAREGCQEIVPPAAGWRR
ncbi:GNAT family N-acetyltransferase [Methanoculleus frigidifontis]|nr:N-acetyltransferase [Methanoculleus sp. FWC-SCC1]